MIRSSPPQNTDNPPTFQAECVIPLTEAQQGLWAQGILGPEAARAFHLAYTVEMRGPYDHAAMKRALKAVTARHEALRTSLQDDGSSQVIAREG
ncbi:MAG TPA: condensation domain-containing protein, partial [Chthoniobacterales bacterium]